MVLDAHLRFVKILTYLAFDMSDRKKKIEQLAENIQSLRRRTVINFAHCAEGPRVTPAQWGALMLIEQGSNCTIKDISTSLKISSSAATQLVDALVASGFVTREEYAVDRRKTILALSRATKNHIAKMKKQVVGGLEKTFDVLSDREFDQFLALTQKLVTGLSNKN